MLETMVQAARRLLADRGETRLVLGEIKGLKFGSFVRPGETLAVDVTVTGSEDGTYQCRGKGRVIRHDGERSDETAVSGRFTMRPIRRTLSDERTRLQET